ALPYSRNTATGWHGCAKSQPYKAVHLQFKAHTQHTVKQHTVNPLINAHVNPFMPSAISMVSVLFISTDHFIGVTRDVSNTKSVSECPPQSH
ncbi:unnamed protein product, partial [Staurois parvus]